MNGHQMTCAQSLKDHDGSDWSDEDSARLVTWTGKYMFCLYRFSCDFLVQLYVLVHGHCMAMLRGVECVYCE